MMQAMAGTAKRSRTSALSKTFAIALLLIPPALRHDPRRKGGQGLEGAADRPAGRPNAQLITNRVNVIHACRDVFALLHPWPISPLSPATGFPRRSQMSQIGC